MLRRLTKRSWNQYLRYFTFRRAKDEWEFDVGGVTVHVENDWYSGMRLVARESVLAQEKTMFYLDTERLALSASVVDSSGREREVEVFVKALHWVFIRVARGRRIPVVRLCLVVIAPGHATAVAGNW